VTCRGDGVGRSCWREAVYAISGRGWFVRTFFRVPGCKQVGRAWVSFSCAHTPNHPISWDAYDGAGSSYSHACGAALTSPNTALRLCFDPNFAHSFTVRHRRSFRSRYILAVPASLFSPRGATLVSRARTIIDVSSHSPFASHRSPKAPRQSFILRLLINRPHCCRPRHQHARYTNAHSFPPPRCRRSGIQLVYPLLRQPRPTHSATSIIR